jgi:hypothetical protein
MSTAFWDAFWAGLACPAQLYALRHDEYYKHVGQVDAAWKKVGGYIYGGIGSMARDIDDRYGGERTRRSRWL